MVQPLCNILPDDEGLKGLFHQVHVENRVVESGKSLNDILRFEIQFLLLLFL